MGSPAPVPAPAPLPVPDHGDGSAPAAVTVRAPGKVNLELAVGALAPDGYHPLATVFQAVSLHDDVTAVAAPPGVVEATVEGVAGLDVATVPTDERNLAVRAARALLDQAGPESRRRHGVRLRIRKGIPVAGGMAGASADAAAALVACDELWGLSRPREQLLALAADLGSDVPFSLVGGTAVGTGRGERLTPAPDVGPWEWVVLVADGELRTPAVYAELDRLRGAAAVPEPRVSPAVLQALAAGDAGALGVALRNDLQEAAVSLRPQLAAVLERARGSRAAGALVSGSGPSVAVLAAGSDQADDLAHELGELPGVRQAVRARGPVEGCRIVDPR